MSTTTTSTVTTTVVTPQRPLYPIGIPEKFSADGVVQRFPGNTTVCHVPADSPLQPGMNALHASLSSHPVLSNLVHLLPKPSWHMTVVDGVRDTECEPGMWPPGMEKLPLDECTREFSKKLRTVGLELEKEGLAPPYKMRVRGFDPAVIGIGLEIEGANPEEEKRLRRGFHITMAYLMRHIDGENRDALNEVFAQHLPALQREFDLGPLEFCTFENMYAFHRLFYLGEQE